MRNEYNLAGVFVRIFRKVVFFCLRDIKLSLIMMSLRGKHKDINQRKICMISGVGI